MMLTEREQFCALERAFDSLLEEHLEIIGKSLSSSKDDESERAMMLNDISRMVVEMTKLKWEAKKKEIIDNE